MNKQTRLQKVLHFFLVKIIIGIVVVGGSVAVVGVALNLVFDKTGITENFKNTFIAIAQSAAALVSYIFLFRFYEKRKIQELNVSAFTKNAIIGFLTGFILQSIFIVVIYFAGGFEITQINPFSFLLPSFITAFTAGFVGEILIRGIFFRLAEEQLGTVITLIITALIFAIIHSGAKEATFLSVCATTVQAGILLSAAYIFNRNLWLPIFLHFSWDFVEPGIFGAINPGNTIKQSLFTSEITGPAFVTGGQSGPQNSIQSLIFCSMASLLFLWLAKRKNNFLKPGWKGKTVRARY